MRRFSRRCYFSRWRHKVSFGSVVVCVWQVVKNWSSLLTRVPRHTFSIVWTVAYYSVWMCRGRGDLACWVLLDMLYQYFPSVCQWSKRSLCFRGVSKLQDVISHSLFHLFVGYVAVYLPLFEWFFLWIKFLNTVVESSCLLYGCIFILTNVLYLCLLFLMKMGFISLPLLVLWVCVPCFVCVCVCVRACKKSFPLRLTFPTRKYNTL
jgi:hypothetical protein